VMKSKSTSPSIYTSQWRYMYRASASDNAQPLTENAQLSATLATQTH
jgi:hypothetical protein